MWRTADLLRVRFERGVRWALERYHSEATQALITKVRLTAAQLLMPPGTAPPSAPPRQSAPRVHQGDPQANREDKSHDVLVGLCGDVALRDLNLVDSLLAELEGMEANEADPDALARLYQLDHLAARLRRNAENLRVLAGYDAGSAASGASPLVDVIRAAMSSIEQYPRVEIGRVASLAVVDFAGDDLSRLLSELLDNATVHSPPASKVMVSAYLEQGGVLVRIEDAGIGLPEDRLQVLNARLCGSPALDSASVERMGLAVVGRLAAKLGIQVRLDKRVPHGTTAEVHVPENVVCEAPASPWSADPPTMQSPKPAPASVGVQADPVPSPRPSSEWTERTMAPPSPTPRTTRNGLPRRVPQSMREFAGLAPAVPGALGNRGSDPGGREQLIADLGDFSDGEQAARAVRGTEPRAHIEDRDHPNGH